jgi:hypothetical protein
MLPFLQKRIPWLQERLWPIYPEWQEQVLTVRADPHPDLLQESLPRRRRGSSDAEDARAAGSLS